MKLSSTVIGVILSASSFGQTLGNGNGPGNNGIPKITASVTVEYCTANPSTNCKLISNEKAAEFLSLKGYEIVNENADKSIVINLHNGCAILDSCQSGIYIEQAKINVIDNKTKHYEKSESVSGDLWPRTSKHLLSEVINKL